MATVDVAPLIAVPKSSEHLNGDTLRPLISNPHPPPRTVWELVSRRAEELPNHPILGYPDETNEYHEYTYAQLRGMSLAAAGHYLRLLPMRSSPDDEETVIGLLGASDLDYVITAIGLSYLGFTVLFLSTRLAESAYVSLLNATHCRHMVVTSRFEPMATALQKHLPDLQYLGVVDASVYKKQPPSKLVNAEPLETDLSIQTHKVAWIIHSSGSTGPPKPIYQTHHAALRNYENSMNMEGFITLPFFHAHGLSSFFRAVTAMKKIYLYSADLPLTSKNLLSVLRKVQFEIFYGVPYALKLLSETDDGIEVLARMKVVMFGGSACPDALGDLLVSRGVNVISHYGTTETGQLMSSFRPKGDMAWNYVRVGEKLKRFVRWEERGAGMCELVVLDGWPSKVASNREDGAYATKDLFERHPKIEGAWKYVARLDDTLVLMNGEKAIPIGMEMAVRKNEMVREVVCCGAGMSQLGMLIVKSELASGIEQDQIIDQLWPTIEEQNRLMPGYAHVGREAIRILPADTPFPQTDKGTVIRQAFYRDFNDQIEKLYAELQSISTGTLLLPADELRVWLRGEVLSMLGPTQNADELRDDTDLFALGVDSLQSTRLRGTIMQQIQLNGHLLPQNIVFDYPTISKLADQLISIRDGKVSIKSDVTAEMERLVAKYSVFPREYPKQKTAEKKCVVVTGATGSLGAHIVAQLTERDDIDSVFCLVRASSLETAIQRVEKSLAERKLLADLPLKARSKITSYPSDFSKPDLGLSQQVYKSLCKNTTTLIHSAWSVNFNKTLPSFEADCIAGAVHLINLCRSASASFNFCSSVSAVVNTPTSPIKESLPPSYACAQGMGYAQSKLVTETLVSYATKTGLQARVLRIGQIVADTKHGVWNDTEAIPLMLQAATAPTIGALPTLDENARWLPVDLVAETVVDISLSPSKQAFFNVVNPRTFHWTMDLLPALRTAGLKFREVGQREWMRLLRSSEQNPESNPTVKLVEFFAGKYDTDEKRKELIYATDEAERCSPALARAKGLEQELVDRFVRQFMATSWAPKAKVNRV